jgi:hypothetical protein
MKQQIKLTQLSSASYFDMTTLQKVVGVSDNSMYSNVKRWLRNEDLVQLKRGMYVTTKYTEQVTNKEAYAEFIANTLKRPSYISCEYVLQKYNILTESVYSYTSIALKKTKTFSNNLGTFIYNSITPRLFTGFSILNKDGFEVKQASKAKALFDFLYLRLYRMKSVNPEYISSLRLNLYEISQQDFVEFESYTKLSSLKKLNGLTQLLKKVQYDN